MNLIICICCLFGLTFEQCLADNLSNRAQIVGGRGLALVEARVIGLQEINSETSATVQIDQVYVGPTALSNRIFSASHVLEPSQIGVDPGFSPPLELGEKGLWVVVERAGRLIADYRGFFFVVAWPVRYRYDQNVNEAKHLASTIADVSTASENNVIALLTTGTTNEISIVRYWSYHALAAADPNLFKQEGRDILKRKLSPDDKLVIDEILTDCDAERWAGSVDRLNLLNDLAELYLNPSTQLDLLNRIENSALHRDITGAQLISMVDTFAQGKNASSYDAQKDALWIVVRLGIRSGDEEQSAYEYLLKRLDSNEPQEIRFASATALALFASRKPQIAQKLESVKSTITNEQSRVFLENALKRHQD